MPNLFFKPHQSKRVIIRGLALAYASILIAILAADLLPGHSFSAAISGATSHQPETFTELYFSRPKQIPTSYTPDQPLAVNFTIHNLENRDMAYALVFTGSDSTTQVLATRSVFLKNGSSQDFTQNLNMPPVIHPYLVSVTIPHLNQAIHFWVGKAS